MRTIQLSDYPGEKLQAARQQRRASEEEALIRYEHALAQHRARTAAARAARDEARVQRRWLPWLRGVVSAWAEQSRAPARPVFYRGTTDREQILAAGMTGEQLVANELGRVLGDDWVLLRGYRNRSGEIDHLLLGPRGLFAIEVKHRNATVRVNGDEWWFDKYDRFGNLVGQGRITDRGGRSPSRQVNDSADELQRFLNRRGQDVAIQRIIVLTHPRSKLGSHRNLTVAVATSVDTVLDLVNGSPTALQPAQIAELGHLVEQDHRFHVAHSSAVRARLRRTPQTALGTGRSPPTHVSSAIFVLACLKHFIRLIDNWNGSRAFAEYYVPLRPGGGWCRLMYFWSALIAAVMDIRR